LVDRSSRRRASVFKCHDKLTAGLYAVRQVNDGIPEGKSPLRNARAIFDGLESLIVDASHGDQNVP
jgi:hypothetical protein